MKILKTYFVKINFTETLLFKFSDEEKLQDGDSCVCMLVF